MIVVVFGVISIVISLWIIAIYNGLLTARNGITDAFSQIDVQLSRRYDLIPNLVEIAKGTMAHEKGALEGVILGRNIAQGALSALRSAPRDAMAIAALSAAESVLGAIMNKFMALFESYPDLQMNQDMMQLLQELASTENRVAFARQAYNDAVLEFNKHREVSPNNIIAAMFGFLPEKVLKIAEIQIKRG